MKYTSVEEARSE